MGFAPNYFILATILLVTGISVAPFHSPAPAMIAEVSGKKVGLRMSLFMAGGELGRTERPIDLRTGWRRRGLDKRYVERQAGS
jgi:FSR family fosmidomycin resistance protein-like MFS transporter